MILEVCANSFESALAAQEGGAHRIELCQELSLGGITPSHGLLTKVVEELEIPVYMLLRPRSGGFTYTDYEFDIMLRDLAFAKEKGVKGIVSGVLNSDFTIDERRTEELIEQCGELSFTFHRAFDWVPDPKEALQKLICLKVYRVLTSGQQESAFKGLKLLTELLEIANNKIGVLPGGGITLDTILHFKTAGFPEVHGSFSVIHNGAAQSLEMSQVIDMTTTEIRTSSPALIRSAIELIS